MNTVDPPLRTLFASPGKSLGQKAYDLLLDRLLRRDIPPGAVIQERPLAEMLEISRTPVREALNRLESEGFITRKPGRLMVVKEFSTRELIETLHVRQVLEVECVGLATGRVPEAELESVEAAIRALLAGDRPSAEEDWNVDCRFHTMIATAGGNGVLADLIANLRRKTHMFNLHQVPERFEIGHREHLAIIAALRDKDRDAAREGIRTHIENVRLSIIRKLSDI
ncbi:GntR family transcriptional regulator [Mangrovicella endophytica]|uniref:GntR family transcriptional regulator n=1 Tax=Mangrovicella endophytica TaxID=2066697 RepID=UPI000C9DD66E|nr:GntR family transcriptional regulator [Mangrovicella endophytica]